MFGIIQGTEAGWTSPLIITSFTAAATMLAAFVMIERSAEHPMLPLRFFSNRDFTGSVLVIGIMFFAGPATFFFLTQFFQIIQGRDPFEAGLLILPNVVAVLLASAMAPALTDRLGPKWIVTISVGIMAVAAAIFTQIDPGWSALREISVLMLFGFGFGFGFGPGMPALTDSTMASVPVEDAGIGSVGDAENDGNLGDDGDFDHIHEDLDREFALSAMVGGVR